MAEPRCPLCRKHSVQAFRPFCSSGCKDRDLVNWLDERYTVPIKDDEADDSTTGLDRSGQPPL